MILTLIKICLIEYIRNKLKVCSRIPTSQNTENTKVEAFSSYLLKFSPKLESYTVTLSTSSSLTALIVSFCGWLRA